MMTKHFLLIFSIALLAACENNISEYDSFDDAVEDDFFDKGWIPNALVYPSMKNIYLQTNNDLNTCIYAYSLSSGDLYKLENQVYFTDEFVSLPRGIKQPEEWISVLSHSRNFLFIENNDTVFVAIEDEGNRVLGWRN